MSQAAQAHSGGIPRGILIGAGALDRLLACVTLFGRASDIGALHMPHAQPYQVLQLDFVDGDDGSVAILDAADGANIYTRRSREPTVSCAARCAASATNASATASAERSRSR